MSNDHIEEEVVSIPIFPPKKKMFIHHDALEALLSIDSDLNFPTEDIPVQFSVWMFDPVEMFPLSKNGCLLRVMTESKK